MKKKYTQIKLWISLNIIVKWSSSSSWFELWKINHIFRPNEEKWEKNALSNLTKRLLFFLQKKIPYKLWIFSSTSYFIFVFFLIKLTTWTNWIFFVHKRTHRNFFLFIHNLKMTIYSNKKKLYIYLCMKYYIHVADDLFQRQHTNPCIFFEHKKNIYYFINIHHSHFISSQNKEKYVW